MGLPQALVKMKPACQCRDKETHGQSPQVRNPPGGGVATPSEYSGLSQSRPQKLREKWATVHFWEMAWAEAHGLWSPSPWTSSGHGQLLTGGLLRALPWVKHPSFWRPLPYSSQKKVQTDKSTNAWLKWSSLWDIYLSLNEQPEFQSSHFSCWWCLHRPTTQFCFTFTIGCKCKLVMQSRQGGVAEHKS